MDQWQIAIDAGKVVAAVCLDFSKAFDNVQHQTLLLDLSKRHLAGTVLLWMRDYLSLRFQRVVVGGDHETAEFVPVVKGVPQGSILGPTLFNIYLAHLPDLVSFQRVQILSFADDVTLHSVANSINEAVSEVTLAVSSVGCNLAE